MNKQNILAGHCPGFFFSVVEPNLQKQYHDLDKKNSVFDQMYKLYTKRLVNKDTFKEQTGIKVKAMPKPHRNVRKPNMISVSKDWKGTPPKGYKMRGSYDKNTKEWSFYMVKDKLYTKRLVGKDAFKSMTGIEVRAMPKPHKKCAFRLAQLSVLMYNMPIPYTTETIHPFPKEQTA